MSFSTSLSESSDSMSFESSAEKENHNNNTWLIWTSVAIGVVILLILLIVAVWIWYAVSKPDKVTMTTPSPASTPNVTTTANANNSGNTPQSSSPRSNDENQNIEPQLSSAPIAELNVTDNNINVWQNTPTFVRAVPPPSWGLLRRYEWQSIGFLTLQERHPTPPRPPGCRGGCATAPPERLCPSCARDDAMKQHNGCGECQNHTTLPERIGFVRKLPLYGRQVASQRDLMQYMALDVKSGIQMPVLVPPGTRYLNSNDIVRVQGEDGLWVVHLNDQIFTYGGSCSTCLL